MTIWFALEEIDESRGTLCLNKEILRQLMQILTRKQKSEHEKLEIEGSGNFGQSIVADWACDLLETMQQFPCPPVIWLFSMHMNHIVLQSILEQTQGAH